MKLNSQTIENPKAAPAAKNAVVAEGRLARSRRLRTPEAAEYCGCSEGLLRALRLKRKGPAFSKLSYSVVVYDVADLDIWLAGNRVETAGSTGDMTDVAA